MRVPLRYILPVCVFVVNIMVLFAGWLPLAWSTGRSLHLPPIRTDISPQAHPILARVHFEQGQWYWISAVNMPAFWTMIPLNIMAQHRGEEVGAWSVEGAREMLGITFVGLFVWYFVGWSAEGLVPVLKRRQPCKPWSATLIVALLFATAAALPAVVAVAVGLESRASDETILVPAGCAWFAFSACLMVLRVRQVIFWRREKRGRSSKVNVPV